MSRFIVRARGPVPIEEIVDRLRRVGSIQILDSTARMVLIDADSGDVVTEALHGSDAVVAEETSYRHPSSKPRLRG
jgi:hypothetical protein